MALFRKRPEWGLVYRLEGAHGALKSLLTFAFWIWGVLGFIVAIAEIVRVSTVKDGVGVGTSAFVMMEVLIWMGGMLFFALAAMLTPSQTNLLQEMEETD